jgi:hypothetical protein
MIKLILVFLLLAHAIAFASGAGKSKASVALPKAKKNKNNKWKILNNNFGSIGVINKVLREAKVAFCSELEALTLQV